MKKLIVSAFCLGFALTSAAGSANASEQVVLSVVVNNDDRQPVKPEELPEAVKKTLATDAYKGWTVREAALVNKASAPEVTTPDASAGAPYYEVVVVKDKESKTLKFYKDGTAVK